MGLIRVLLIVGLMAGLSACSKFKTYNGPEVTRVAVYKTQRSMALYHNDELLKVYPIELGFTPEGHKQFRGDGKTPEGRYYIDRKNPNSSFHLSLGISYPNAEDRAYARKSGKSPGGDIFIHGQKSLFRTGGEDWTAGCISVKNKEMEDIYAMVGLGTVIDIYP